MKPEDFVRIIDNQYVEVFDGMFWLPVNSKVSKNCDIIKSHIISCVQYAMSKSTQLILNEKEKV